MLKSVTEDKIMLRRDLEEKAFMLSASLSSYAATHPGMKEMYRRIHFTKSHLLQLRETELIEVISILNNEVQPIWDEMAPYGVTDSSISELMAANDIFKSF